MLQTNSSLGLCPLRNQNLNKFPISLVNYLICGYLKSLHLKKNNANLQFFLLNNLILIEAFEITHVLQNKQHDGSALKRIVILFFKLFFYIFSDRSPLRIKFCFVDVPTCIYCVVFLSHADSACGELLPLLLRGSLMTDDEFLALLSELAPGPFVTGCPGTSQAWK